MRKLARFNPFFASGLWPDSTTSKLLSNLEYPMFSAVYLECDGGGAGLCLVAAEGDPLLLEALLVLEVVLHVGQHLQCNVIGLI